MLKKTIQYTDYNDEPQVEDFYFHMSEAELAELELGADGGLKAWLERIIAREDGDEMVTMFKRIILGSLGKKSMDGKRFVKNDEIREDFVSSPAYSVLFMELITNVNSMIEFINGMVPKGLGENTAKIVNAENGLRAVPDTEKGTDEEEDAGPEPEVRKVYPNELEAMGPEQLRALYRSVANGEAELVPAS